jgi:hypothetical protein
MRRKLRHIISPIATHDLDPLAVDCEGVVISGIFSEHEHKQIAKLMRPRPGILFSAISRTSGAKDIGPETLDFLKHYDFIEEFDCASRNLICFKGLESLPASLKKLRLGNTYSKEPSLSPIRRFISLSHLSIGEQSKNIEVILNLEHLEVLRTDGVKFKEPHQLAQLRCLKKLWINGGDAKSPLFLEEMSQLTHLGYGRMTGLASLEVLRSLTKLEALELWWMKQVKSLPDFSRHNNLWCIQLLSMAGIADLSPIAAAPNLRQFHINAPHALSAAELKRFAGHRTMKSASVGASSDRAVREYAAALGHLANNDARSVDWW